MFTVREHPIPVYYSLPHQYGQHLLPVFCTDDAVLMVNAKQHNLCLKLGIIQQVLKVLPEKKANSTKLQLILNISILAINVNIL